MKADDPSSLPPPTSVSPLWWLDRTAGIRTLFMYFFIHNQSAALYGTSPKRPNHGTVQPELPYIIVHHYNHIHRRTYRRRPTVCFHQAKYSHSTHPRPLSRILLPSANFFVFRSQCCWPHSGCSPRVFYRNYFENWIKVSTYNLEVGAFISEGHKLENTESFPEFTRNDICMDYLTFLWNLPKELESHLHTL